jgi:HPt (histidine-containing phosphotransfer) domain-containing protein
MRADASGFASMNENCQISVPAPSSAAAAAWRNAQLLDYRNIQQWGEDLSEQQIKSILDQVPDDSRANVARILTAVALEDRVAIKSQAHRLKGMAANIGAVRLAELSRVLEYGAIGDADVADACAALPMVLLDTLAAIGDLQMVVS